MDREFFDRVWACDASVYARRIEALEFHKLDSVLDAGCGMGQWTIPLAQVNGRVYAIDFSMARVRLVHAIAEGSRLPVFVSQQSIESLSFADAAFDAVFCYSVIYLTDYRQSLREMHRVLKPGGRLYVSTNGLGWYLRNIAEPRNASSNYNPRQMAIDTLANTLAFFASGERSTGQQLAIPSDIFALELERAGFVVILRGAEGTLSSNRDAVQAVPPFYDATYAGVESVYDVLAEKRP